MDPIHKLAVEIINKGKQALVFCPSRASAEKTAEEISKLTNLQYPEFKEDVLKASPTPTKQCKRLAQIINKGIAFHHAGLLQKQKDLVEDEFRSRKIKVICATPSLCLSGDSEIWQPNGNILVKNFKNSELFVLSQSNKLQVMKAQEVNKNKNLQKLIKITNVSGHSIKLTPDHRILIKRENKKKLIQASECNKKDKIATIGKLNITQTTIPKISEFVINNELPFKDRILSKLEFYFIGSMLGDGHSGAENKGSKIIYKGSPTFTSCDEESISLISDISKGFNSIARQQSRFGTISLVLSKKKWFREFLCRSGVDIGKNKFIHPTLMQANINKIKYIIQGLFDTDGCVENLRNISFSNISIKLIKDLQRLLLRFGIVSRLRTRPAGTMEITSKVYKTQKCFEIVISQNRSIFLFHKLIGFNLVRKQEKLRKLVRKISTPSYLVCEFCSYKIYKELFSGRTKEQKEWGRQKFQIINLLGEKGELGSREIKKTLGFEPKKKTGKLNQHYYLISKRRVGSRSNTEWYWSLNKIGSCIYKNIISKNKDIKEFFNLILCPLCENKLKIILRKKWRDSDFDGDIFWDYVNKIETVKAEEDVYDVVLPNKPNNDHLFVANGFIVHNSAGLSMPAYRVIIKSLKRFSNWGMDWIPVLEYMQMAGRAGRPEYEKLGESIVVATNEPQKQEIYEKYICGVPEEIYSKLAVEPVLRTYLLSLISSGIISNEENMKEFFMKTFWAHQYNDMAQLELIMNKMLDFLEECEFIKVIKESDNNNNNNNNNNKFSDFVTATNLNQSKKSNDKKFKATLIGKRISELYLDPLTAKHLLDCLKKFNQDKNEFSLLQMVSHTLELRPLLRVKAKQQDFIQESLVKNYHLLLQEEPSAFDHEYSEFINSIKTTLFFDSWINENHEDYLLEQFDIRPGEIRYKLEAADWLLYASEELSKLMVYNHAVKELRKLRVRVKQGVKEELLPLLKLKGIGRIRARKLFNNTIRDLGDVKKIDFASLSQLLGSKLALDVKKQVGEEIKEIPKGTRKGQLSLEKY